MKPRKFQEINKTKYVGFICLVTLGLSWNHINVISIVIWWTMDSRCPVWPLCRRWVWSQGNGWRLFLGWAEAMDFWMIVDGISIVYLWYIYGISMVYHVAPKKAPTCWNLIFGGFALQGLSYIFPSPWACPRVACMPLYANVNGENAHEQWHFGGCFTHFSDQLTRRYVLFHPSEGLFQNMFMRIWIWINPLIIPEGLFQRRFVYR